MNNPQCAHGERVLREGTGPKGPWAGWFCNTPKGTPDQCSPEWVKKNKTAPRPASAPAIPANSETNDLLKSIDAKLAILIELAREKATQEIPF